MEGQVKNCAATKHAMARDYTADRIIAEGTARLGVGRTRELNTHGTEHNKARNQVQGRNTAC